MTAYILIPAIFLLISLYINFILARKFEDIATQKGYDSSVHSFAMCFWLGIIGYIYVAALPNLKAAYPNNTETAKKVENTAVATAAEKDTKKEKYNKLIAKAERFKDTFFDRNYRIRTYESIISELTALANEGYEDATEKLNEYTTYLEMLKDKKIK